VDKPDLYDPQINRSYAELAAHYGTLIDPARAFKPKDKPQVAYCTPSGRFVGMLCSFRSPAGASVSLVEGRRVGLGRVVEQFVLIVIALPTDKTGVVPGFDGRGGHAEQYGHLAEGDQAGATQPLLAAA